MRPLIIEPGEVRGHILFTRSHCDCPCDEDGHPSVANLDTLESSLDYVRKYGQPPRVGGHEVLDEQDLLMLIAVLKQQDSAIDARRSAAGFVLAEGDRT